MEKEIYGYKFNIQTEIEDNHKKLTIIPSPEKTHDYQQGTQVFSENTLNLLWSKHYFGIEHNTTLFEMMYNTFKSTTSMEDNLSTLLLRQQLFCDLIIRAGIIVEEFAAICTSIEKYINDENIDIAEAYLAASQPIGFYNSIQARGDRMIKKLFRFPEAKFDSRRILSNLSNDEIELVWKGVNASVDHIKGVLNGISELIYKEIRANFTIYDAYNKLKHAFAPMYQFIIPNECTFGNVPLDANEEDLIKSYLFNNITIMHDKVNGQRTPEERERFERARLATPTLTQIDITPDAVEAMFFTIKNIDELYSRLIETYIAHSKGFNRIYLTVQEGAITEDEYINLKAIIDDDTRYISTNNQE
ncbi:TPA: hypothetical protein QCY65_005164 [Bacillus cereus]|nr:hypothetical protein [Bacillus cereus]